MNSAWRTGRLSHPVPHPVSTFLFSPGGAAPAARFRFCPCPAPAWGVAGVRPGRPRAVWAGSFSSSRGLRSARAEGLRSRGFRGGFRDCLRGCPRAFRPSGRPVAQPRGAAAGGARSAALPAEPPFSPEEPLFFPAWPPLFGRILCLAVRAVYRRFALFTVFERSGGGVGVQCVPGGPLGPFSYGSCPSQPRGLLLLLQVFLAPYI